MTDAVTRLAGALADRYRIERGLLKPGFYPDVIAFDPKSIREQATNVKPEELWVGMRRVFVDAKAAVEAGVPTGALAGRALRT